MVTSGREGAVESKMMEKPWRCATFGAFEMGFNFDDACGFIRLAQSVCDWLSSVLLWRAHAVAQGVGNLWLMSHVTAHLDDSC